MPKVFRSRKKTRNWHDRIESVATIAAAFVVAGQLLQTILPPLISRADRVWPGQSNGQYAQTQIATPNFGYSLRWESPIGPLRLVSGAPVNSQVDLAPCSDCARLYFDVGTYF